MQYHLKVFRSLCSYWLISSRYGIVGTCPLSDKLIIPRYQNEGAQLGYRNATFSSQQDAELAIAQMALEGQLGRN